MESLSAENIVSLITIFVSWLLVIFLLTAKTKNKLSNILLALFLIVNAQDSSGLFASYFLYPKFPGLGMLLNSTVFFKMPLLYLYILSVTYSNFKLQKKDLWHAIPWILNLIILIPRFFAVDFDDKWTFLNENIENKKPEIYASYILIHVQIIFYFVISFLAVKKYKTLLLENHSNASLFNYKWLNQLLVIYAIESVIATLKNVMLFAHWDTVYFYTQLFVDLLVLVFISWIVMKAMHHSNLFRGVNYNMQLVKHLVNSQNEVANSLSPSNQETIKLLKNHMIDQEPFLDASLTVDELAEQMNIPTKELSILINHNLNQHFFDFVNGYRIEKAKKILSDPSKKHLTVLEILYDVGFNSKSSFNTAFKKQTQQTPTQFRANTLNSMA